MVDMNNYTGIAMEEKMIENTMEPAAHPTIPVMVMEAVAKQKRRVGVSLYAIKKYITEVYKVDTDKIAHNIRKALKKAVTDGKLVQTLGGVGAANGSFKLPQPSRVAAMPKNSKSKWSGPAGNFALPFSPTNWATDEATPVLRVMIIRALEFFHAPGHNVETRVSYEVINSYLQETFDVKTDCLKVLNEMVQEGILTQSLDGKYSKMKRKHERKVPVKPDDSESKGSMGTRFERGICGLTSSFNKEIKIHMQVIHDVPMSLMSPPEGGLRFECGICSRTCVTHESRVRHTLAAHKRHGYKVQCYICKYCGYKARLINNFYYHINCHTDDKYRPHKCSVCSIGFHLKRQLRAHMNVHSGRRVADLRVVGNQSGSIKNQSGAIGNQSDTIRNQSYTIGNLSATIGSRNQSYSVGNQSCTVGSQSSIGNQSCTTGSQSYTIGSQPATIGSESYTIGSQSDTIGNIRNDNVGTFFSVCIKEETEVPLLNPELVPIAKSKPGEFVFTDYLNKSPLPGNEPGISCTVPDLRILITDALKCLTQNSIMDSGVSYELIDSYLKETFRVRTDCLKNVLNAMVLQGIIIRSDEGKYELGPMDVEYQDFNRLMTEVLTTPEDSPVSISEIQKYLKRRRKGFVKLLSSIQAFLQIGLENETILRIAGKTCFRYRLANPGEKQQDLDLTRKKPRLGQLITNDTPLEQGNQLVDMYMEDMDISQLSPQISETVVKIEKVEVEVKIENETENLNESINQMWTPEVSGPSTASEVAPQCSGDNELKFEYGCGMSFL